MGYSATFGYAITRLSLGMQEIIDCVRDLVFLKLSLYKGGFIVRQKISHYFSMWHNNFPRTEENHFLKKFSAEAQKSTFFLMQKKI